MILNSAYVLGRGERGKDWTLALAALEPSYPAMLTSIPEVVWSYTDMLRLRVKSIMLILVGLEPIFSLCEAIRLAKLGLGAVPIMTLVEH